MRIDVPKVMNECVKLLGGDVLDEVLPPDRDFKNADYRFEQDGVIAELKCVQTRVANDQEYHDRFGVMLKRWLADGLISRDILRPLGDDLFEVVSGDLPPRCFDEVARMVRDRVFDDVARKANKQVKQTRDRLGPPQARGLLLLGIDAHVGLSLRMFQRIFGDLLLNGGAARYRGIGSIVVFSANYGIGLPSGPFVRPWFFMTGEERPAVDAVFARRLGKAWADKMAAMGGPAVLPLGCGVEIVQVGGQPGELDRLIDVNFRPV